MKALLITLLAMIQSSLCWADIKPSKLSMIHPTQPYAGLKLVQEMVQRQLQVSGGTPEAAIRLYNTKPFPAILAPDGRPWITDYHHGALVFYELQKLAKLPDLPIEVDVEADFSKDTWENFYKYLITHQRVYFSKSVRLQENTYEEKLSSLPRSLAELSARDYPFRSFVAKALRELSLKNELLVRYIEFYIAEELEASKREIPTGHELNPDFIRDHLTWFQHPSIIELLEKSARNDEALALLSPHLKALYKPGNNCSPLLTK